MEGLAEVYVIKNSASAQINDEAISEVRDTRLSQLIPISWRSRPL